jgi:DMSO reductase anchor subunit
MHPAYSVIFFTTASGAGYGLLAWLAAFALAGLLPPDRWLGFVSFAVSLGLIAGGLLSSMLHLGHPERFLKALTQWRSSWLAREGITAIATFVPAGIFGVGWVFLNSQSGLFAIAAVMSLTMATVTVFFTSMIYASLVPIRQWNTSWVPPVYLALAAMTGLLLLVLIARLFGFDQVIFAATAGAAVIAAWVVKTAYWYVIDHAAARSTIESATGLGKLGKVKLLEMPHSEENFVMREMGYRIARKHAQRLRGIVHVALFALPLALCAMPVAVALPAAMNVVLAIAAAISAGIGVAVERWLFFAEATHTSMLYYGRDA